jgi:2-polyprenyl-3-methyl-5-hydroxy-6-metoxy-1,4-benzoquinol methylase
MRRPRILVNAANPCDGTSYYRAIGPYSKLDSIEMVLPKPNMEIGWHTLSDIDVVLYQRPANQTDVVQLEMIKSCRKKIIVDYDDWYETPSYNPAHEFYSQDDKQACIKACLKIADIVTVSTSQLRENLLKQVPTADIRVVPNAVDDNLFDLTPSYHERNKTILIRGASGHSKDWELYKDGILQILKEFPDYTLSVFGFHPNWLREVPEKQLRLYQFQDIPHYFEQLMEIRPEIMIVPLEDNDFNRCKSVISLFEGVVAGAAVIAADLPEFRHYGACVFKSNKELVVALKDVIDDKEVWEHYYESQIHAVPKLSQTNRIRKVIIEDLLNRDKKLRPIKRELTVATDREFYEYALSHGHSQDEPEYQKHHGKAVEWLIKTVNPKTVVEYGCGPGGTLIEFLKRGIQAYGLELNPYNIEYIKERYPMYANNVFQCDFTKEPVDGDTYCDLGMSIEVFEHITMPDEWWDNFIQDLSKKYKYFYFTSTPFYTTEWMDNWWGHVNIRRSSSWIQLFERNGFKFLQNPRILVSWDMLFSSKILN